MKNFKQFHKIITEGGAFGHLSHPFDVHTFTFKDLEDIINNVLNGKLEYAEEKTDGHNLMLTYRNGVLLAARNQGHLKNRGATALNVQGMAAKFKGRGNAIAYTKAMDDFSAAVNQLNKKQIDKIFADGQNWMSVEVIMPINAENIIKYGTTELRLHGTVKHNENGEAVEQINKENARMLDGMIRQKGSERQDTYHISKLNRVHLPKTSDFAKKKSKYVGQLKKIMKLLGAKPNMTMRDVRINYFTALINKADPKKQVSKNLRVGLIKRWVDYDKGLNLRVIKKELEGSTLSDISAIDKSLGTHNKSLVLPLEKLFLTLGADVLQMMGTIMAASPNDAIKNMKSQVDMVTKKVLASGDVKLIDKLNYELKRLETIGGWDAVIPSEGITFMYKDQLLKITGTFAPLNQLIGLQFRLPKDN